MSKTIITILRCRCGEELFSLQQLPDDQDGQRTIKKRCEACGAVTVIRKD